MRFSIAIWHNDPIILTNDIRELLIITPVLIRRSTWFCSGYNQYVKSFRLMRLLAFYHVLNCRPVSLKVRRVCSRMKTCFIFDCWFLELLTVALCLPSVSSYGPQISKLWAWTFGSTFGPPCIFWYLLYCWLAVKFCLIKGIEVILVFHNVCSQLILYADRLFLYRLLLCHCRDSFVLSIYFLFIFFNLIL